MGPTRRLDPEEQAARKQREVVEKDTTEIQLEKILFGDQTGFLNSLNAAAEAEQKALTRIETGHDGYDNASDEAPEEDMLDVPDEDLFFLDAGTTDLPEDVMEDLKTEQTGTHEENHGRTALWYDSDDERITVSLASNTRLRKLRDTEDDDIVNGLEYINRLRRQYERLHPTPDWVNYARKKTKLSHRAHNDDSDTDSDISIDSPSTKPLAELLRSAGSLMRQESLSTDKPSRPLKLRPEVIDIQRLKDIASSGPSSIDVLQFHPTYPLLLTAGPSSTINLYHTSPHSQTPNPLLTSLHVKGTPITSAAFALTHPTSSSSNFNQNDGGTTDLETKIYLSARRRYFHTWSLNSGTLTKISRPLYSNPTTTSASLTKKSRKNAELPTCENLKLSPNAAYVALISNTGSSGGVVHILSSATHQPICQCRVDSLNGIADVAFWRDSSGFSAVGKNGEVSEYSLAERRVIARWMDEGAVGTTTLALGGELKDPGSAGSTSLGNDRWIAIGSTSGIVNIYDRRQILAHFKSATTSVPATAVSSNTRTVTAESGSTFRPKPLRVLDQLTTPISHLHFSEDAAGQLLVMASRWKKNALRLVHLPSATVYRNWPTDKTPLGRISSVALSPEGRYLVVGNEGGKVRLWQIRD
ncbi:U3 snoRNP protein [Neophaeococcomyces mojaviensis]|uniref:U3 snoRNP protein n=1 Tax=Neophaeococcomyces mojaviensis TaxID=3383035 RepID=A0ACC3A964_9EURO|nr:U3 snoRNP protein [Knufia sp. JES_112]